ncbi:hypothetical protein T4E_1623 [Trichinella pseudospiralis]|uniref:Uncharacterized protein n=1 Tax=Trichinella pseudospiralis TaxID=6337 RepID=A0A0V0Y5G7_TRIPS|nr:hypothetical protein T4E_1623 [Trichinella pseudospiralis]
MSCVDRVRVVRIACDGNSALVHCNWISGSSYAIIVANIWSSELNYQRSIEPAIYG